jgi:hypothetical protein
MGTVLMQTATCGDISDKSMAEVRPFGITSRPADKPERDPTCFWFPNFFLLYRHAAARWLSRR